MVGPPPTYGSMLGTANVMWSSPVIADPDNSHFLLSASASDPYLGGLDRSGPESGIVPLVDAPKTVLIRSPLHGIHTFDSLPEEATVAQLMHSVAERLRLAPGRQVQLSSWGNDLPEHRTLSQCRLKTNSVLDMRVMLSKGDGFLRSTLERVRVINTALETQLMTVDDTTTAMDLKLKMAAQLARGEHEWYSSKGERSSAYGTTVLVAAAAKADEKAGTSNVSVGEQLVTTTPFSGEGKGKPINCVRAKNGRPACVQDNNVVPLDLLSAEPKLSFGGRPLADESVLWACGVRQDDTIMLEFKSPVMPAVLQLLRAPEKPKGEKKGKGGGGKKKK